MQIGVDVGGTNTDGVIMSDGKVLISDKKVTTSNVGDGVFNVIKSVLEKGKISSDKISSVMVGTTHFTNALVERKRLQKIAAIRLSLPAADSLEQMIGWPKDLISTLSPKKYFAKGGYEVDGREISPLDEDEINNNLLTFEGVVEIISYQGSLIRYIINSNNIKFISEFANLPKSKQFKSDEKIQFGFDLNNLVVF